MERSIDEIAKHCVNRDPQEAVLICKLRRHAFRLVHASTCNGRPDRCDPTYSWCSVTRDTLAHVLECDNDCEVGCEFVRELVDHLNQCHDEWCDICRFKHHNIDNLLSEDESDVQNGERFIRDDFVRLEELVDNSSEESELEN